MNFYEIDFEDEIDPYEICRLCRRECYEFIKQDRTYCGKPKEACIYMSTIPDSDGDFRCMNIEKRV